MTPPGANGTVKLLIQASNSDRPVPTTEVPFAVAE